LGKGFYSFFHIDDLNGWEVGIFSLGLWGIFGFVYWMLGVVLGELVG